MDNPITAPCPVFELWPPLHLCQAISYETAAPIRLFLSPVPPAVTNIFYRLYEFLVQNNI